MSGTNPFRRKDTTKQLSTELNVDSDKSSVNRPDTYVPPIDTNVPKTPKSKIGKSVRIISPHSANSDPEDEPSTINTPPGRSLSPPPEPLSRDKDQDDDRGDPFGSGLDEESINSDFGKSSPESAKTLRNSFKDNSKVPSNPFKKTLANIEQVNVDAPSHDPATNAQKPQYGVDEFKTLLLTGEKPFTPISSTAAPAVSFPYQQPGLDTSSNTDTSSISRVSIFDATFKPQSDSPRTSQEISISDEEGQSQSVASSTKVEGAKPSTPRHRHGKLVKDKAPLTVPFEDPAFSPTDVNVSSEFSRDSSKRSLSPAQKEAEPAYRDPISYKKSPPAPPPARRHGQSRPSSIVPEGARSLPVTEESHSETQAETPQSPPGAQGSNHGSIGKPRPPPPRRARSVRHDSSSSIPTTGSFTPLSDQSTPTRVPLQTPPTRSPSIIATQKPAHTSPQSSSPSMPPPPPPPRRRGSSQSSYTPSRLSGDYRNLLSQRPRADSEASSISQLQMPSAENTSDKKDVLADLSALQREVDELRGKMNR